MREPFKFNAVFYNPKIIFLNEQQRNKTINKIDRWLDAM